MLKLLGSCALLGAAIGLTAPAGALPLVDRGIAQSVEDNIIAVRDGCGPGYRFSNRRQACVPMGGPGYAEPDPGAAAAAAIAAGVIGAAIIGGSRRGGGRHHGHGGGGGGPRHMHGGGGGGGRVMGGGGGGNRPMNGGGGGNRVQGGGGKGGGSGFAGPPNSWKKPGTGIR